VLATSIFLSLSQCFLLLAFLLVEVITLQPLPPLPPYVPSSRATPDEVLSISSLSNCGGRCFYMTGSSSLCSFFFFHFGEGRPLHNVQFLIFSNPTDDPFSRFANFSNIRPVVFSFLSRICRLVLGSFTPVLPSGSTRSLFPNAHPFRVPLVNFFLACSFRRPCALPLSHSGSSLFRRR
jgi:hypothetical protein